MIDLSSKRLLVVAPHFDDEVLGCGGVLAGLGESAGVAFVCGRTYGHEPSKSETDIALGQSERARAILGYGHSWFGSFYDEYLHEHRVKLLEYIEGVRDQFNPDVVMIPSRRDMHRDHVVVFEEAVVAFRDVGLLLSYYVPSGSDRSSGYNQFVPNVLVGLSPGAVDKKVSAMSCYLRESRDFPSPRSPEGIRCTAKFFGMTAGKHNGAEPFELIRVVA